MDVFVAEDSASMRKRLVAALEEVAGVEVVGWADRAGEATEAVARLKPQFVVLDLRLAEGSGLSVLEAAKHLDPPPVVAVLTNFPYEQYRARCAELGADGFFDKAQGLDGLLVAVRATAAKATQPRACA
jgi:DNA-binding NarL/FixJ family response regulator